MGTLFQPQMTQFFILDFYRMVHSAMKFLFFSKMVHSAMQDFLRKAIFIVTAAFFQDKDPALFMFVPVRHLLQLSSLGGHGQLWLLPLQFLDPRYYSALFMFVPFRNLLQLSSLGGHGQLWLLPLQFLDPLYYSVVHTDF